MGSISPQKSRIYITVEHPSLPPYDVGVLKLSLQALAAVLSTACGAATLSEATRPPPSGRSTAPSPAPLAPVVFGGLLASLVSMLRHPDPALRLLATGAVACVAQSTRGEAKLLAIGAVEGLVYALVDLMQSSADALFRSEGRGDVVLCAIDRGSSTR